MTEVTAKTPEELAAIAETVRLAKEAADAAKAAKKVADKAAKDAKAAESKVAKDAKAAEKEAAKVAAAAAKVAEKAAKEEAKLATKPVKVEMPEQNDVRRPKPETLCGQAWAHADNLSRELGQPVPIATLLAATNVAGLNEGNVRAEYARWRKFNGVSGRITAPVAPAVAETAAAAE